MYTHEKSPFTVAVIELVQSIPSGRVATYKQIAELAGKPHASRGVSWVLNSCSTKYKLPWHRVLNSQGKISFDKLSPNFCAQKRRLKNEGINISEDGQLSLDFYKWKKRSSRYILKKTKTNKRPKIFS